MGLLFVLPTDKRDRDHLVESPRGLILKSYGLPPIFWGYLIVTLGTLSFLFLAAQGPLTAMVRSPDVLNASLAYSVFSLFALIPFALFCVFFYKKSLIKGGGRLQIIHKVLGIPLIKRDYNLEGISRPFVVCHHLDSPNMAKIKGNPKDRAFYNQGYYILYLRLPGGREVALDRHSRRADLEKIMAFLSTH